MKKKMGMGAAAAALLLCASAGNAGVIEFNIDTVFSSFQADGYVNVKFEDAGGDVKLTITSFLQGSEFISGLYLNFDDSEVVKNLSFNGSGHGTFPTPTTKSGSFSNPQLELDQNAYQADGDGRYDILLSFGTSGGDRFDGSDSVEYLISYAGGDIYATDFWHLSAPAGGHGPFYAAGHIQGIGTLGEDSGWHSATLVPLPTPVYLGLAGLGLAAGVSVVKRRR
jgi:hypothetical protein